MSVDEEELAVLADDLQQRGDPRGELIATALAIARLPEGAPPVKRGVLERRFASLLERHHDALYGALAPHVQCSARPDLRDPALEVTRWHLAFVDELTLRTRMGGPPLADVYRIARALPIAERVRALYAGYGVGPAFAAAIVADPFPQLRELTLGNVPYWRGPPEEGLADLEPLVPLVGRLEKLICHRNMTTPPLESDTLVEVGWFLQRPTGPSFARSRLPRLRTLRLGNGAIEVGFCGRFPALEDALLYNATLDGGFVEDLLASPALDRLHTLHLPLAPADLEQLMRRPDRLAHLKRFEGSLAWFEGKPELVTAAQRVLPSCAVLR